MKTVEQAFAYITHKGRLLVFRHPKTPAVKIQVPAGTVEQGETPRQAVLREAAKETGLSGLVFVSELGTVDFEHEKVLYRRHFFHLAAKGDPAETWRHEEQQPSDGREDSITFEFFWAPLPDGVPVMVEGHAAMLPRLLALNY